VAWVKTRDLEADDAVVVRTATAAKIRRNGTVILLI
jgi:hypothetical protein